MKTNTTQNRTSSERSQTTYLICRTKTEGPPTEAYLNLLSPWTYRNRSPPITDMTENRHFCEVYFTDVHVPIENLVGVEGEAFKQTMRQLEHERGGIDRLVSNKPYTTWHSNTQTQTTPSHAKKSAHSNQDTDRETPRISRSAPPSSAGFSAATKCLHEHEWRVAQFVNRILGPEATLILTHPVDLPTLPPTQSWEEHQTS